MGHYYEHYKHLFNSVKPIRGRAVDTRPIGERRRDWELIQMDGEVVECVLYQTPVVRYYPDGRIGLQCGGWPTPSTAEFIHIHSPFLASKRDNKVWVRHGDGVSIPLPMQGETTFLLTADNKWAPENPVVHTKQVINREKAKEARAPFMPFIKFMEVFFKMSDGWLMDATKAEFGTLDTSAHLWGPAQYDFGIGQPWSRRSDPFQVKKFLEFVEDAKPEDYMRCLCMLTQFVKTSSTLESRLARTEVVHDKERYVSGRVEYRFYDRRYDYKTLKAKFYRMIEMLENVHDVVEVEYK